MREIALHVLDLMENSIAAGARRIAVRVVQDRVREILEVTVEDDGCGLGGDPNQALSPFFTTKPGKRTGLGLSLVREAAERADGAVTLARSSLGGTAVRITMGLYHVDRMPLGDLPATLGAIACTAPDVEISWELEVDGRRALASTTELRASPPDCHASSRATMRRLASQVRAGLERLGAEP